MIQSHTVGYYIPHNRNCAPRNRVIVVTMFDELWSHTMGPLRYMNGVCVRPMLAREVEIHKGSPRLRSYRYKTLAELIEDERRAGVDEATLERVKVALGTFEALRVIDLEAKR